MQTHSTNKRAVHGHCDCVRVDGSMSDWFHSNSDVRQGCTIAPDLFLLPMDWVMERTVHRSLVGATVGEESVTDLDFADDVSLIAEMREILELSLAIMQEEASPLGLELNWSKTKILTTEQLPSGETKTLVNGNQVEIVDSFTYLGSTVNKLGSSTDEVLRRIIITKQSLKSLDKNIWRSKISLTTKIRLYNTCILPILLYGADTWTLTTQIRDKLNACDMWCLRHIMRIPYTAHITNNEIRRTTGQASPVSDTIRRRRLQLFGHMARSLPAEDHRRLLEACIADPPHDWRRPRGRPRHTWLRTVQADLKPLNVDPKSALDKARDRVLWRQDIEAATLLGASA